MIIPGVYQEKLVGERENHFDGLLWCCKFEFHTAIVFLGVFDHQVYLRSGILTIKIKISMNTFVEKDSIHLSYHKIFKNMSLVVSEMEIPEIIDQGITNTEIVEVIFFMLRYGSSHICLE